MGTEGLVRLPLELLVYRDRLKTTYMYRNPKLFVEHCAAAHHALSRKPPSSTLLSPMATQIHNTHPPPPLRPSHIHNLPNTPLPTRPLPRLRARTRNRLLPRQPPRPSTIHRCLCPRRDGHGLGGAVQRGVGWTGYGDVGVLCVVYAAAVRGACVYLLGGGEGWFGWGV